MLLANITNYTQPIEGFLDKLEFGGMMVALGMGTVFSVLIILWIALIIFKLAFHDLPSKKKVKKKVKEVVAPAPVVAAPVDSSEEIVAAIAAAIAMAESESNGVKFRVVSFRRR